MLVPEKVVLSYLDRLISFILVLTSGTSFGFYDSTAAAASRSTMVKVT